MYEQISSNIWRSRLIIVLFIALIAGLAYVFAEVNYIGYPGVAVAALIAIGMSFGSYYYSDTIVLKISRAVPAEKADYPYLINTVEGLSIAAGIPMPRTYVIDDTAPNAFATGRDPEHAAIAVTSGLLEKLDRQELEGVIAHEMSHIQNFDIRLMGLLAVLVGLVALLSDWMLRSFFWGGTRRRDSRGAAGLLVIVALVLALIAPLIAQILRMAISRKREFLADANGAMLTRYPPGLAAALRKISEDPEPLEVANKATAHLYIANPLKDAKGALNSMFDTHPPIRERIERLDVMSGIANSNKDAESN